jgi:hypothetical protein
VKKSTQRLGAIDRHLNAAQGELGSLINIETRAKSPALYKFANDAFDKLEKIRREVSSRLIHDSALKDDRERGR